MISYEQALEIVLDSARVLGSEHVEIACAANRILAEDVKSDIDMPPFDKSAMDGYACRREDLGNELAIVEVVAAGASPTKKIGANQCAKIMTGAPVPDGADCVVMVEYTENPTEDTMLFTGKDTTDNICFQGEDIKSGQVVLGKGLLIEPQHIATLACVGCVEPLVSVRPKVGVIVTGDELVAPKEVPEAGQIRDSSSGQLCAQVERMGAIANSYGIIGDDKEVIDRAVKKAISENDVVLISGGSSMGDYDFVPEILKQNGIELRFEKIAVKPGKPTIFGVCEDAFCFGMPGNPVSTFVVFEILVKQFLYKMMGHEYKHHDIPMPLAKKLKRKKTKRQLWVPVAITDEGKALQVDYHGSADISALCGADGLVSMDVGVSEIEKETVVKVRLI